MSLLNDASLTGFIVPARFAGTLTLLHQKQLVRLRTIALTIARSAIPMANERDRTTLTHWLYWVDALPAYESLQLFDHPLIRHFLLVDCANVVAQQALPLAMQQLTLTLRPGLSLPFATTLSSTWLTNGCLLSHLGIRLAPTTIPVYMSVDSDKVMATWASGYTLTVSLENDQLSDTVLPHLVRGGQAHNWQLLNGWARQALPLPAPMHYLPTAPAADVGVLTAGRELLAEAWPVAATVTGQGYKALGILANAPNQTFSQTTDDALNALFLSVLNPVQVGDAICHEHSHTRFCYLFQEDPLLLNGYSPIHPSPWRSDKRPLTGILNGVHAFLNVVLYYRHVATILPSQQAVHAQSIEAHEHTRLIKGWNYLKNTAQPTPVGERILADMEAVINQL